MLRNSVKNDGKPHRMCKDCELAIISRDGNRLFCVVIQDEAPIDCDHAEDCSLYREGYGIKETEMTAKDYRECVKVPCLVIDEDTVRYGGSAFKRERTCHIMAPSTESMPFGYCSECEALFDSSQPPRFCSQCGAKVVDE